MMLKKRKKETDLAVVGKIAHTFKAFVIHFSSRQVSQFNSLCRFFISSFFLLHFFPFFLFFFLILFLPILCSFQSRLPMLILQRKKTKGNSEASSSSCVLLLLLLLLLLPHDDDKHDDDEDDRTKTSLTKQKSWQPITFTVSSSIFFTSLSLFVPFTD